MEFSKLVASSLLSSALGSFGGGGWYLQRTMNTRQETGLSTHHSCRRTQKKAQNCRADVMMICPARLDRTFLETRLAVGRFGWIFGKGAVRPTNGCQAMRDR